ncbi:hypothetical protein OEZ86_008492 [Tetradesmus obliquus]|nr:hypothetical protein OEZ86_008492 [Tetradesmus obliquus]
MEEPQQEQHVQQQQLLRQQQQQPQQHQQQPQQLPQASNTSPVAATAPYAPPTGVKKTFYKRKLPCPPATEFSSAEGRLLFAEALQQGTMTGFFKLIEQYSTQDEPAFCGLASIAMVLNALSIDPKRPWKGSWRWFHEQLLDCCLPLATVAKEGVVLTQAACLAKCNGANVSLHRFGSFSLQEFRHAVAAVAASGEEHLVVSYSRKAFSQTGDGHFSPVGGYHAARDLVLILDTARFKYPPHWVPLPMLYEAMSRVDPTTGQPRGFLRLSANTRPDSVLFTLDIRPDGSWREAEHFIKATAPELVQAAAASGQLAAPEAVVARLVSMAPLVSVRSFIAVRYAAQMCAKDRCVPHTVRQQVLQELRATPLHQVIEPLVEQMRPYLPADPQQQQQHAADDHHHPCHEQHQQEAPPQQQQQQAQIDQKQQQQQPDFLSEKLTMLLLLQEPSAWGDAAAWADPQQLKQWQQLLDASAVSIVEGEVQYLRQQLMHIEDVLHEGRDAAADDDDGSGVLPYYLQMPSSFERTAGFSEPTSPPQASVPT